MATRNQLLENTKQDLADNLRKLRAAKGISQEALADLAGLHRTYISHVERLATNVTLKQIVTLAELLGVQPYALLKPSAAKARERRKSEADNVPPPPGPTPLGSTSTR